jgi:hypothetical protein
MIVLRVIDMALLRIWRHYNEWNPRSFSEEVRLLDVAGIVGSIAFIESDENCG